MKPIGLTFIDSLSSNSESPVIQVRESENATEPEIISPTKIISCDKCSKLFSSQKKLEQHKRKYELIRASKVVRTSTNI